MSGQQGRYFAERSIEEVDDFYDAIDRAGAGKKISPTRPYVYTTLEIYDVANGIRGAGGLGILAADTRRVAQDLDIPFVVLTPFYQQERHQTAKAFIPTDYFIDRQPKDFGFQQIGTTAIHMAGSPDANLEIWEKRLGSTRFLSMTEPNFGALYTGDASQDHRLYQMVSLGFGGYEALKIAGLKPAVMHLNETATTFAAIARLDELCRNGMNLYEALVYVRDRTLYTNHTLVQAAEPSYSYEQFEKFVFPNIKSPALRHFIGGLFRDDRLVLNSLMLEIAGQKNCVSKLHAKVINFHDLSGERVDFRPITNGIHLPTWVDPAVLKFLHDNDIIDRFDLPTTHFRDNLATLVTKSADVFRQLKRAGRAKLNNELLSRHDQYGETVQIPADATLFEFKRRFVSYKRPWMPFANTAKLRVILEENNAHYIMAGMMPSGVGPGDETFDHLQQMFHEIANDPFLRQRVHYIADYDEKLATAMSVGGNISINVPAVGWEACGTSFMKDIANLNILIATNDGGVADVPMGGDEGKFTDTPIHLVHGDNYDAEVNSLYANMADAAEKMRNNQAWAGEVARQLSAYLPTISGARMMRDYLRFLFRTEKR
ncbi:MAG: glycogen/starch/alpha-glucan phosphorylase [Candidatus Nanoperiomorbaceae bacterium]